jgi:2-C-methyl-D-erythritol 4-phosphate cytidylyltransferase
MQSKSINTALIVAGGRGVRMGSEVPKQFLLLAGRPVLMWTIESFLKFDSNINLIVVLPEDQIELWEQLCAEHEFEVPHETVSGGEIRFYSVRNGLDKVTDDGFIAIHDGVRPILRRDTIKRLFESCKVHGNAIPTIFPTESVRQVNCQDNRVVDRNSLRLIQTPQVFQNLYIKGAYTKDFQDHFTDDAAVLEASGHRINLVRGQVGNIKITTPEDLLIAEALLEVRNT